MAKMFNPHKTTPEDDKLWRMIEDSFDDADQARGGLVQEWEQADRAYMGDRGGSGGAGGLSSLEEGARAFFGGAGDDDRGDLKGIHRVTLNRTGNAILANTADEIAQPVTMRLDPVATGKADEYWLSPEAGRKLAKLVFDPVKQIGEQAMGDLQRAGGNPEAEGEILASAEDAIRQHLQSMPVQLRPEQMGGDDGNPTEPLDEDQVPGIRKMVSAELLPNDAVMEVGDGQISDVAQRLWDHLWDQAQGSIYSLMNELRCNVFGHQPMRLQWEADQHRFRVVNDHILNVWIDPDASAIEDAEYVHVESDMTIDEAAERYPDIPRAKLEEAQNKAGGGRAGVFRRRRRGGSNSRPRVVIRVSWFRHRTVPLSVEDAVNRGLVNRGNKVDGNGATVMDAETGALVRVYTLPKDKDSDKEVEVDPQMKTDHKSKWPDGPGVEEIISLPDIQTIVARRRCPYWDIPIGWNRNIPRTHGPYGMGEPKRLRSLDTMIDLLLTIIHTGVRNHQFPQFYMPATLYKAMQSKNVQMNSRPGFIIPMPDAAWKDLVRAGGWDAMTHKIEPINQTYVNMLQLILQEHDAMSNNIGIRQGRAPFAGASGDLVEALHEASQGALSLKARFTEDCLRRIGKIGLHAIRKWMPESEVYRLIPGFPIPMLRSIMDRMSLADFSFTVEVAAGRGVNRRNDDRRTMQLFQGQLLSRRTTMEKLRVPDPAAEMDRIEEEQKEQAQEAGQNRAMAQAAAPPQSQGIPQPPQEQ